MFLNKEVNGAHYNRGVQGADADSHFTRPDGERRRRQEARRRRRAAARRGGDDLVFEDAASAIAGGTVLETRAMLPVRLARAFNDEMGFVPRGGVDNSEWPIGTHIRLEEVRRLDARNLSAFQIENFTKRNGGGLESRYMDWHWPVTFQNSAFVEVGANPNEEVIDERFAINSRRDISSSRAATSSRKTSSSPTATPRRRSR